LLLLLLLLLLLVLSILLFVHRRVLLLNSSSCIPQTKKSRVVVMRTFCLFVEHKKEGKRFQKTREEKREDISSFLFAQHARLFTLQF